MKTKNNTLIALFAMIMAAGCNSPEGSQMISESVNHKDVVLTTIKDDDCFDEKMSEWFVEFNKLQELGYDMYEANFEAMTIVAEKFKDCPPREALATGEMTMQ